LQNKREEREAKIQQEIEKRLADEESLIINSANTQNTNPVKAAAKAKMQPMKKPKRKCSNCGKAMKQQFIGLKHCKCGTSWSKDGGYFQRTSDMVFALERQVTKKGKNSIRTKQVPVIRFKQGTETEANMGAVCPVCKGNMLTADGCKPSVLVCDGNRYERIKVGRTKDFYENDGTSAQCTDCGAKYDHYHHRGCDCEYCPICHKQLLFCGCDYRVDFL
jgi:hypothetical protein